MRSGCRSGPGDAPPAAKRPAHPQQMPSLYHCFRGQTERRPVRSQKCAGRLSACGSGLVREEASASPADALPVPFFHGQTERRPVRPHCRKALRRPARFCGSGLVREEASAPPADALPVPFFRGQTERRPVRPRKNAFLLQCLDDLTDIRLQLRHWIGTINPQHQQLAARRFDSGLDRFGWLTMV